MVDDLSDGDPPFPALQTSCASIVSAAKTVRISKVLDTHERLGELLGQVNGVHQLSINVLWSEKHVSLLPHSDDSVTAYQLQMVDSPVSNSDRSRSLVSSQVTELLFLEILASVDSIDADQTRSISDSLSRND